jgi:hypothetical protein
MVIKIFCDETGKNYYLSIEKVSYQISFLISKFYNIKLLVFCHTDQ